MYYLDTTESYSIIDLEIWDRAKWVVSSGLSLQIILSSPRLTAMFISGYCDYFVSSVILFCSRLSMHIVLDMRRSNSIIDLENGRNLDENLEVEKLVPTAEKVKKKLDYFRRTWSLNSIGMIKICGKLSSNDDPSSSTEKLGTSVSKEVTERDRNSTEEKKKRIAKPPRPPKAPPLDMADMKFLRKMTELAKLKRARAQLIKDLKKNRNENASSLSINILPLLVTIVFCFVIIFQGLLGSRV